MTTTISAGYIENAARDAGLGDGIESQAFRSLIKEGRRQIASRLMEGDTDQKSIVTEVTSYLRSWLVDAPSEARVLSVNPRSIPTLVSWLVPWLIERWKGD